MSEVACPLCGETALIGLPRDASIEAVTNEPIVNTNGEVGTRTRKVRCSVDHDVYVTFSVCFPNRTT